MGKGAGAACRPAMVMGESMSSHTSTTAIVPPLPYHQLREYLQPTALTQPMDIPDRDEWNQLHRYQSGTWEVRPWDRIEQYQKTGTLGIFRDGEEVGYVERYIQRDKSGRLYVPPGSFRLLPEHQDGGFGSEYMKMTEQLYRYMGVHRFEITAIDVGSYAWARAGYVWDIARCDSLRDGIPKLTTRRLQLLSSERMASMPMVSNVHLLNPLVTDGKVGHDLMTNFERRLRATGKDSFYSPYELAMYGAEEPWQEQGRTMWLGKYFLTYQHHRFGKSEYLNYWPGVKFLQEPAPTY